MKRVRAAAGALALLLALSGLCTRVWAKTDSTEQMVDTVLFYIRNSAGEDILAARMSVAELEADMDAGYIDDTVHNYALLDRYVTTVHQEAQGLTVPEFVSYAQSKSTLDSIRSLSLTFAGEDQVAFWEIDQSGFGDKDTYTYSELYGVARYNFPLLYQYWDYQAQDYADPAGVMSREEVIAYILEHGEPETVLLSLRAFSQRYMLTQEKFGTGDYNMENLWLETGVMDNERTIRLMLPMTEEGLRNKTSTVSNTRYWIANILLMMEAAPAVDSLGTVEPPTAVMTEDDEHYYITFDCATEGATILYNHNYTNPNYTPTRAYGGEAVVIPKRAFPGGTVTMTCRAVKEGYTDNGVVTLTLTSSGRYEGWSNPFEDVEEGAWYYDAVAGAVEDGIFTGTGTSTFSPESPMSRAMLVTVLYRLEGEPEAAAESGFSDVPAGTWYSEAVAWAGEEGIVTGTGSGFEPDGLITREQLAVILYRYENALGLDTPASGDMEQYTDSGALSSWAAEAMSWAVGSGIIQGKSESVLDPGGTATRAEAAVMLQRLMVQLTA